ncbi:hypothetical protein LP421_08085 [Rhizobium sp. RCAM05350]|nr:hypothetical protein LP421_08085 [Rhizobium sp. RCAM05350]
MRFLRLLINGTSSAGLILLSGWGSAFTRERCIAGLVGDDRRLEFTVLGDTVNVAAKIEQATKRFNAALLASETVVIETGQRDMWQEVGREPLGGRGEHLAIFATRGGSLAAAARSDPAVFNCY